MSGRLESWLAAAELPPGVEAVLRAVLRPDVVAALSFASVGLFLLSALGLPWIVLRLPEDYFAATEPFPRPRAHGARWAWRVGRNLVAAAFFVAGVAMVLLPGQGLLTIAVAIGLADLPGKHRVVRAIAFRPTVWRALGAIRRRGGRPPFRR
ncbi:MAG: hypothetical protein IT376_11900 [Polyangiaceae bacterium]|nr:hypothetical protein [Polyangiaceae bacterium]